LDAVEPPAGRFKTLPVMFSTLASEPMPPIQLSAAHARRFLVTRHLLAPPRSLPAKADSVLTAVERLGLLQFDPLEVPGARNHDLVLHARVAGYRREWCDQWLYGPDRRLIELYNKSLNILPMRELPHYRITWQRSATEYDDRILKEQADVAKAILKRLKADGPLSTAAFSEHGHAVDWWWAPTRASRAVMEAMFVTGRIGISRRDGNRRFYDLMERLVPAELVHVVESEEDAMTHRLLSRYRATGMTMPTGGTQSEVMYSAGPTADRVRRTARLVDDGILLPVEVEGLKATRYILADEEPILDATADPASLTPGVSFLGPLDPLIWDRKGLLRGLFEFDYLWEVYVPEAKRRWGYYVLPMLYGDRFVGRIEPRLDRKAKSLAIIGIWFEPWFEAMETPGFLAAFAEAVEAYRTFVGADRVSWPRTRAGRAIAGALRRVA
jgi:uncharacterized protein